MLAGNLRTLMIAPNLERKNFHVAVSLSDTETDRNQLNETDFFCQQFDITVQIISLISVRLCLMWLLKTTKIPQIKMIIFKITIIVFAHY